MVARHRLNIARRISEKFIFRLLGRYNFRLQPHEFFSIKAGYHHAVHAEPFDDTRNKDEWQKEVYELAKEIMVAAGYKHIIDVGCGSAFKLVNQLGAFDTIGIEVEPALQWLRQQYPSRKWLRFEEADPVALQTDLVLCADVIEHIDNPDDLLDFIGEMNFRKLVISTPERDGVAGRNDYGPPENVAHYREWNAVEFRNYLRRWFTVEEQRIFNDKTVTQVVICRKKDSV